MRHKMREKYCSNWILNVLDDPCFRDQWKKWHTARTTMRCAAQRDACERPGREIGCDATEMCGVEGTRAEDITAPPLRVLQSGMYGEVPGVALVRRALAWRSRRRAVGVTAGAFAGVALLVGGYPASQFSLRSLVRDWSRCSCLRGAVLFGIRGQRHPPGTAGAPTAAGVFGHCIGLELRRFFVLFLSFQHISHQQIFINWSIARPLDNVMI